MKRIQMLVLALLVTVAFQASALAKMVAGTVAEIDATAKKVTISTTDAAGAESKAEVWVKDDAALNGIAALNELKAGDQISVEADQDEQGNWKASTVAKS